MALAKITLKLGKKKIKLTPEEFEELKQDMRQLDSDHKYYWYYTHRYWPTQPLMYTTTSGSIISTGSEVYTNDVSGVNFTGDVLSYSA